MCRIFFSLYFLLLLHAGTPLLAQNVMGTAVQREFIQQIRLKPINPSNPAHLLISSKVFSVFVFLSPECPLCLNYSKTLNRLATQFSGQVNFYGIVPGKAYSLQEVKHFEKKYAISFPLYIDPNIRLSRLLKISVTPEVILLNGDGVVLYQGAIDNWFFALGKNRGAPSENFLANAIESGMLRKTISPERTIPIGCSVNDL